MEALVEGDGHRTFFVGFDDGFKLLDKLRKMHPALASIVNGTIQRGVSPDIVGANVVSKAFARSKRLERELLRDSVSGSQIKRYQPYESDEYIIYTTRNTTMADYPNIKAFMEPFRAKNTCKEVTAKKHPWYALHRPRDPEIFKSPKFIGLTTKKDVELIYDQDGDLYVTDAMYVFSLLEGIDYWATMGILHSKAVAFLYRAANQGEPRVIPQIKASKLLTLPFPSQSKDEKAWEELSTRVRRVVDVNRQATLATTEHARTSLRRQAQAVDHQIDSIVYAMYGMNDIEIRLTEECLAMPRPQ